MESQKILELHKKWLDGKEGGERADLRNANLRNAGLRYADLRNANLWNADLRNADLWNADLRNADLRNADLRNANLDFSCLPLWCGGLKMHIDNKQAIQILFHLLSNVMFSKNVSKNIKRILLTKSLINLANKFHRGEVERLALSDERK